MTPGRAGRASSGGIKAMPFAKWRRGPQGNYHYHALTYLPDGRLEDPSLVLGMGREKQFAADGTAEKLKDGAPVVIQYAKPPEVMVVDPEKPSGYGGGIAVKLDKKVLDLLAKKGEKLEGIHRRRRRDRSPTSPTKSCSATASSTWMPSSDGRASTRDSLRGEKERSCAGCSATESEVRDGSRSSPQEDQTKLESRFLLRRCLWLHAPDRDRRSARREARTSSAGPSASPLEQGSSPVIGPGTGAATLGKGKV